ncbi:hypothetical protein B0J14DRAFT_649972 [Halenospora varia]|nr:hypothetical protein B0J14DRAFT_649972 [Halenospora varia]
MRRESKAMASQSIDFTIKRTCNRDALSSVAQRIETDALPNIQAILAKSGTPSISSAVSHGEEAPHISHLGYRDIGLKPRADDRTTFNINSMTKGIVAAVTVLEVTKGTLLWSTKAKEAIPEFTSTNPMVEDASTVVDMLSRRTGITTLTRLVGEEPIVGKGGPLQLAIYHHGSMPGSTSCVIMIPETDTIIIVLQDSLAPLDTADFVGQVLVETALDAKQANDYGYLTDLFVQKSFNHMNQLKSELEHV